MRSLLFGAFESDGIDHAKMVMSNLGDGGVCFGDRSENLYDRSVGDTRSSIGLWNANGPETRAGKLVQFGPGKNPFSISLCCSCRKFLSEIPGDRKSFLIRCDAVSVRAAARFELFVVTRQGFREGSRHTENICLLFKYAWQRKRFIFFTDFPGFSRKCWCAEDLRR